MSTGNEPTKPTDGKASRLLDLIEVIKSGYAGVMPNGNIVDRRVEPNAVPIPKNSMMGTPEPKPIS